MMISTQKIRVKILHPDQDISIVNSLDIDNPKVTGYPLIGKEKGNQITYHLPLVAWNDCYFAEDMERAPEFDGHTPEDVLTRLKELMKA